MGRFQPFFTSCAAPAIVFFKHNLAGHAFASPARWDGGEAYNAP
jgi:hypothetical protein